MSNDDIGIKTYDELLTAAYAGVNEDQLWSSFVNSFQKVMGARDVSIVIESKPLKDLRVKSSYMLITTDKAPHLTEEYLQSVMDADTLMDIPQPNVSSISDLMATGTFLDSQLYKKFLKPIDVRHLMSVDICRTDTLTIKLTVERTEQQGTFGDREKALFELVMPHLRRAIEFKDADGRSDQFQSFYENLMDKMNIGCFILDEQGRLLSCNECASTVLGDGHGLAVRAGKLVVREGTAGSELKQAIKAAAIAKLNKVGEQTGAGLRVGDASSGAQLDVVVKPLFASEMPLLGGSPTVAVFVNNSVEAESLVNVEVLVKLYGFTKSEARLAAWLSAGLTVAETSEKLGVSVNTAKTHLRGIYEKTGFNRQSQVVALLNKSTAKLL